LGGFFVEKVSKAKNKFLSYNYHEVPKNKPRDKGTQIIRLEFRLEDDEMDAFLAPRDKGTHYLINGNPKNRD
jgi:hypothetical protein